MTEATTDLAHVLRGISGPDLYRNNIFGVTGLPVDATAAQIRRRREEAVLESRLNPELDADAIRSAYETMRDPVARLTHELLWTWAPDEHREVVAAEYEGVQDTERLDALWKSSLDAWATRFADPNSWAHARNRVKAIDDPRLTTGTVRRLRDLLPRHIASITTDLAVRAASASHSAADRLVELLDESPLDDAVVDDVLRAAVRPYDRDIQTACGSTKDLLRAEKNSPKKLATALLDKVTEPMAVVQTLLTRDDDLTIALSDEIALVVNNCAIAVDRKPGQAAAAIKLLKRAQSFARLRGTVELIKSNIEDIQLSALTKEMREFCDKGKVDKAARYRRALLRVLPEGQTKDALRSISPTDKRVGGDVKVVPGTGNVFGIGTMWVHFPRRGDPERRNNSTYMFTLLFIPLIPLSAYLSQYPRYYAKIPLGPVARWWRLLVLNFLAGGILSAIFLAEQYPGQEWVLFAALYAVSFLWVAVRRMWLHVWALGKVDR